MIYIRLLPGFYEYRQQSLIPSSSIEPFPCTVMFSPIKDMDEKHLGHLILLWKIQEHKTINVYLLSVITIFITSMPTVEHIN